MKISLLVLKDSTETFFVLPNFRACSYNIICLLFVPSVTQVCDCCSPTLEFIRLFDVTERTALHRHGTGRLCPHCRAGLRDTIVHFGERGTLEQPLNWKGAAEAAQQADLILCLGSSLKVRMGLEQVKGTDHT